jgi:RNA polymerase sigma-70 factor (ECF subfamily)
MTGNREDALEVSQETLLRAFRYLSRCDLERSFRNWLMQILVNAARDFGGKQSREAARRDGDSFLDSAISGEPRPEDSHERSEIRGRVREAMSVLSGREREIFILRDLEEKSINETAEITKSSAISVRVHLSRARAKLRRYLAGDNRGPEENVR